MDEIEKLAKESNFEWSITKCLLWIRDLEDGVKPLVENVENILQYINQHVPVLDYLVVYTDNTGIWKAINLRRDLLNLKEPGDNRLFKGFWFVNWNSIEDILDSLI
jgi:hypothetical protein